MPSRGWFAAIAVTLLLGAHGVEAESAACFSAPICVTVSQTASTLDFNYESLTDLSYTVAVTSSQRGMGSINHSIHFKSSTLPRTKKLFSYQVPRRGQWDYEWRIAIHLGEQTAQHDAAAVYSLPFKSGTRVRVVQGYDGARSHSGSQRYAIDFGVPVGTEVRAARDGVVVGADATSSESSRDGIRFARANYVWVQHSDGTLGYYLHLRPGGVVVGVRQIVKTGQLLGYSGCTGQCNGPHLHFHVSTPLQARDDPKFEAYKTFPTVFATTDGAEFLESDRSYAVP